MLNRFCPLSKNCQPPPFLTDDIKINQITNQNQMNNTCPFYIVFKLVVLLHNVSLIVLYCNIRSLDLLLFVVFISFYISRYHFSQILRTSLNIISKKDFRHNFSFLMDSLKLPHPLNSQNLLSVTKVFLSMLPQMSKIREKFRETK